MRSLARDVGRLSTSLLVRGIVMMVLGLTALAWPSVTLIGAMFVATALLALSGAYEMVIALRARRMTPGWVVPMANGAACVGFATLSLFFLGFALELTLWLVAVWLVCYAALTGALALALWPMTGTRRVLIGWTVLDILLAILAVTLPSTTISTLLYTGAAYALAFGALQAVSALWIRRVAVPHFLPPAQTAWRTAPELSPPRPDNGPRSRAEHAAIMRPAPREINPRAPMPERAATAASPSAR